MFKKNLALFLSLISCSSSISNKENKKQDIKNEEKSFRDQVQPIVLNSKKYKNTEIVILKGDLKSIEKEITPNKIITEIDIQNFKKEYSHLVDIAQNYIKDFQENAYIPIDFVLNYSKIYLRKVLEETEKQKKVNKIDNRELFIFSFALDTYLALKKQSFIIHFNDYTKAFLEAIKSFIDDHPKEKVYFAMYNTLEESEEDFIEAIEEVFEE